MATTVQNTVVVLEMRPKSSRDTGNSLLRICASGVGRELGQAEHELNTAIESSEKGCRDLVSLHRFRATRVYSKATKLEAIEDALKLIYNKAGNELPLPLHGFFELSRDSAVEAIGAGLAEYKKKLAAKKRRQAQAKKAREVLALRKQRLRPVIEEVVNEAAPHTVELCAVLDGLEGGALQKWAETELSRKQRNSVKKAGKDLGIRNLVVEHSKDVDFDAVSLREIQRQIEYLEDDSFILTVGEEDRLWDLEEEVDTYLQIIRNWRDALPSKLKDFASVIEDEVKSGCPLASSF